MKVRMFLLPLVLCLLLACNSYDPLVLLSEQESHRLAQALTPYVHQKPEGIGYSERFSQALRPHYARLQQATVGRLRFYARKDSLHYFYYVRQDPTSLFEHYLGFGGVFMKDAAGGIAYLDLFFQTPRLSREEETRRGLELFETMLSQGHVQAYLGNRDYIKTPNADFYYNSRENRWDYTQNSSWRFLEEAKAAALAKEQ